MPTSSICPHPHSSGFGLPAELLDESRKRLSVILKVTLFGA